MKQSCPLPENIDWSSGTGKGSSNSPWRRGIYFRNIARLDCVWFSADLVPMYHFGENETYHPVSGICPKRLRNMQVIFFSLNSNVTLYFNRHISWKPSDSVLHCYSEEACWDSRGEDSYHISKTMTILMKYNHILIRVNLESVIGDAIRVEKTKNPTQEQVCMTGWLTKKGKSHHSDWSTAC